MAEVVLDVLNSALGTTENFGQDAPPGSRAIEVATSRVTTPTAALVFQVFGRPARTATCDCERSSEPALPETLYLMTDSNVLGKITGGRLKGLLTEKKTDEEVIEELFLATLSRRPRPEELDVAAGILRDGNRVERAEDLQWALLNTVEFLLNH